MGVAVFDGSRKARFNKGWAKTRKAILERDRWSCQRWVLDEWGRKRRCGAPANEVDHIVRSDWGELDDDSPSNLEALCSYHHKLKTENEAAAARRERARRRKEERWYSHPAFRA